MRQESGPDLYYLSYAVAKEAYDTWIRLGNDGCYFVGPTIEEKAEAVFSSYSIPARFIHEYLLVSVHLLFHEKVEITFELPSKTRQAKWVGLRGNVTHRDIWGLFCFALNINQLIVWYATLIMELDRTKISMLPFWNRKLCLAMTMILHGKCMNCQRNHSCLTGTLAMASDGCCDAAKIICMV